MAHIPNWPASFTAPQGLQTPVGTQLQPTMTPGRPVVLNLHQVLSGYELFRSIAFRQALPQSASVSVPTPQQLFTTMHQQNPRPVYSQPGSVYRPPLTSQPAPPPPQLSGYLPISSAMHQWTTIANSEPVAQDQSTQRNQVVSSSPRQEAPVTTMSSPSTNSSPSDPNLSLPSDPANESGQVSHLLDFTPSRSGQQMNTNVESSLRHSGVEPIRSASQYLVNALHEMQRANYIWFYQQLFTRILSSIQVRNSLTAGANLPEKTINPPSSSGQPCSSSQNNVSTNSPMPIQGSFQANHSSGSLSLDVVPQKPEPLQGTSTSQHPSPGSATGAFTCNLCPKSYSQLSALKMHVRTHTLPCRCSHCGKSFSRKWLLKGHERTHTGERPYACTVCNRSFADRSNLRAHLQTHQREKRYACRTCPRSFSRMGLLNKHVVQCPGKSESQGHSICEVKIRPAIKGGPAMAPDYSPTAFLNKEM